MHCFYSVFGHVTIVEEGGLLALVSVLGRAEKMRTEGQLKLDLIHSPLRERQPAY